VILGEASAVALKAEGTDVRFIHIDLNKLQTIQAATAVKKLAFKPQLYMFGQ